MRSFELTARRWGVVVLLAALPLGGCGGNGGETPPAQEGMQASQPLSEEAQVLIDQGNAAQREGRYTDALGLFTEALRLHPDHPVPQFGSLMAATAVGDTALVRSLREKLAVTGPELLEMLGPGGAMGGAAPGAPGASHMPGSGLPPGHPSIETQPPDTARPSGGISG